MAAAGTYKRIPVCKELYADSYTPVEMMRILHKASHHCYLLESASQNEVWGRYSFLGYDPSMEITCTDGTLRIRRTDELFEKKTDALETGKAETNKADALHIGKKQSEAVMQVAHPGDAIRKIIQQYKSPVMDNMPTFTGGLVGYFSYDYIKYSEPKLDLTDEEQQEDPYGCTFPNILRFGIKMDYFLFMIGYLSGKKKRARICSACPLPLVIQF